MSVDKTAIQMISNGKFIVSDTDGIVSNDTFAYYLAQSTAQACDDLPSDINSVKREEAIALLVCHRIERSFGKTDVKSESLGGEHSTMREGAGETSWSLAYNDLVKRESGRKKKSALVLTSEHSTASTSTFKLDTTSQVE